MATAAGAFNLFVMLALGHFVADFGLQSDRMANEKCPGTQGVLPWQWWLGSHGAIHGFMVGLLSGQAWLGLLEWLVHVAIDRGKCRHSYGLVADQLLHLGSKGLWALLAMRAAIPNPWWMG
jgi:hypothetical protein